MSTHHRLPSQHCPSCNVLLDGASPVKGSDRPKAGDVSCCIECATFLRFNASLRLEVLPLEDFYKMPGKQQSEMWLVQFAIKRITAEFAQSRPDIADDH